MAKNAVAKKENSAVALADSISGETGAETLSGDDFAIPFVRVLQTNSPQVNDRKAEYITGSKAGMFLDTGSQEVFDGEAGIDFIPCYQERKIVEWISIEDGGGFVGAHDLDAQIVKDAIIDGPYRTTPDGHELVDTIYFYCQMINGEGEMSPAVLAFASSQLKKAKNFNNRWTKIRLTKSDGTRVPAPMWSQIWNLTTVPESNDKGDWFGVKFNGNEEVSMEQFEAAQSFRDLVKSGTAKMAKPSEEPVPSDEDDGAFD